MGQRLEAWHAACPKSAKKMNCNFNLAFIELNYHQTRLLLYGPTPSDSPEPKEDHFQIIAESGEKVIQHYQNLHRHRSVNYTWVAVHNLFMAGTSYLYALYHSPKFVKLRPLSKLMLMHMLVSKYFLLWWTDAMLQFLVGQPLNFSQLPFSSYALKKRLLR